MTTPTAHNQGTSLRRGRGTLGESFTEVLVSILISALGVGILAAAVATALRVSQTSGTGEGRRADCVSAAESQLAASSFNNNAGTITVTFGESSLKPITFNESDSALSGVKAYTTKKDTNLKDQSSNEADPGFENLLVFKSE